MTVHVQAFVWTWVFISFKQILISEIAGSQYRYIFKFLINYQVVFQRGCAILHSTSSVLIILGVVYLIFSFFQFNCSVVSDSLQPPWTTACHSSLSITKSCGLPKLMAIESLIPSNHLIFCRPLLLLPSIFPNFRIYSNESALRIRWPKYWSFSFNISPSNEHPGLISLRMDWLDLLQSKGL